MGTYAALDLAFKLFATGINVYTLRQQVSAMQAAGKPDTEVVKYLSDLCDLVLKDNV